jgi:hypothetical protein
LNDGWTYLGISTFDASVSLAAVRPKWRLTLEGRKPRGEWEAEVLDLRRDDREAVLAWLHRSLAEKRGAAGESTRLRLLLDTSEPGAGDLLVRAVRRHLDQYQVFRRLLVNALDVTERDVDRSTRADGTQTVSRREVLAPLLEAVYGGRLSVPRGRLARELADQTEALRKRTAKDEPGQEDLVRAVAVCTWALELEGGGRLKSFGTQEPITAC